MKNILFVLAAVLAMSSFAMADDHEDATSDEMPVHEETVAPAKKKMMKKQHGKKVAKMHKKAAKAHSGAAKEKAHH